MPGFTVKDIDSAEFIQAYASYLKKSGKVQTPAWTDIVKTAVHKELAPYDDDWYFVRCAALARRVYLRQNTGIGAFAKHFGTRKRRGTKPNHHADASRGIIRSCLTQLEKLGVIGKHENGGRVVTVDGRKDLDRIAAQCKRA